jgi:hypothetical protein
MRWGGVCVGRERQVVAKVEVHWLISTPPRVVFTRTKCNSPLPCAAYKRRRMSTIHPAVGPATANSVVTQFLLSKV